MKVSTLQESYWDSTQWDQKPMSSAENEIEG